MRRVVFFVLVSVSLYCRVFSQHPGDNFFPLPVIHSVELTFAQLNFWDSLIYYKDQGDISGTYHYMPATAVINGTTLDSIGVRLKGNSSYNSSPGVKKSIKLDFNRFVSGQEYDKLRKLNLNNGFKDPTMLREKIMLDFCQDMNIPAPRAAFAKVYINGNYWGLYSAVEQIDDEFLNTWFSSDLGNLYKGDPHGSLKWISSNETDYYPHYDLKNNELINDWSDLVNLIDKINNSNPVQFHDSVQTELNTDVFINAWAASILFVNLDSYQGSGHNYYIYHDHYLDYFQWIIWDVNEAFGNFNMWNFSVSDLQNLDILFIPMPPTQHPLTMKMIGDSDFRNQYADVLCNMIHTEFTPEVIFPRIDSLADAIRADIYADTNKMYTNQEFENNIEMDIQGGMGWIPGLKPFVTNRQQSVNNQLLSYGCWPLSAKNLPPTEIRISPFPNPFDDELTFNSNVAVKNAVLIISDITGREMMQCGFTSGMKLQREAWPAGMYFYSVLGENGMLASGKIIAN